MLGAAEVDVSAITARYSSIGAPSEAAAVEAESAALETDE